MTFVKNERHKALGIGSETLEFNESTLELHQSIEPIGAILNKYGCGELHFGVYDNEEIKGDIIKEGCLSSK